MSLSANIFCFVVAACFFIALFWPWDKTPKKKSTESEKILQLNAIIEQLRFENEELQEYIPSAIKLKEVN